MSESPLRVALLGHGTVGGGVHARLAFGVELREGEIDRRGTATVDGAALAAAAAEGRVIRLVAECRREGRGIRAAVRPCALPPDDFLAGARNEENRLVLLRSGAPPLHLAGPGAGREPTSGAVLADLLEIARHRVGQEVAR
ncbi:MAG TPA: hypothetical protein VFE33_30600 [Thermoanaerobaculia bacterium]|nr:hypothetical protein [Thermoanaerobaculia bacterium]